MRKKKTRKVTKRPRASHSSDQREMSLIVHSFCLHSHSALRRNAPRTIVVCGCAIFYLGAEAGLCCGFLQTLARPPRRNEVALLASTATRYMKIRVTCPFFIY